MDIAMIGTGYVGLVAGTCFADAGHRVICADSDQNKINLLKEGQLPFFEPGLPDLFQRNRKRMTFVSSTKEAVQEAEIIFVAVGTPETENGGADLSFTLKVISDICQWANEAKTVVLKSTVPIGTAHKIHEYCQQNASVPIDIVNNPEFLRQGAAVTDFLNPDRVVIGCRTEQTQTLMTQLYEPFLKNGATLISMDNISAEMTKYAANSFLALKICFVNELALLADQWGGDIQQVTKGFTSDRRINPAFFQPGIGYGGSCFPKDVRALIHQAEEKGLDLKLLRAADQVNERQKKVLVERLIHRLGHLNLKGAKIALWGLSFKPNTDDVRRAPSLAIIEELVELGAHISAYDPVSMTNAQKACSAKFTACTSALEAVTHADALLLLTEWNEFKSVDLDELKSLLKPPYLIFDGRNAFDPHKMSQAGFEYYGIGRQALLFQKKI